MRCFVLFSLALSLFPGTLLALKHCDKSHCADFGGDVKDLCGFYNKQAGDYVAVVSANGLCKCACSCVTEDTNILMFDRSLKRAGDVQIGDRLFSPFRRDGYVVEQVFVSNVENYPTRHIVFEGGDVETSSNHLFVLESRYAIQASALKVGDEVMSSDGALRKVIEVKIGDYTGRLINFGLTLEIENPAAHIYCANGLLSGDQFLQGQQELQKEILGYDERN